MKYNTEEHKTAYCSELPQNKQLCNHNPGQENRTVPVLQKFPHALSQSLACPSSPLQKVTTLLAFVVITDFWF